MTSALEFLGGDQLDIGRWRFDVGRELHGAFGGAFGGVVSAISVMAGRDRADGRRPMAADCRFVRGLPAGPAKVTTAVVSAGRSLTNVAVEIHGADGRLACAASVSYVDGDAIRGDITREGMPARQLPALKARDEVTSWAEPPGLQIPMLSTFEPRGLGRGAFGVATSLVVPWDVGVDVAAETACLAADLCVGPPVDLAFEGEWIPHPNPDVSVRFIDPRPSKESIGIGRLEYIESGIASVSIEVWADDRLAAIGSCSSLLMPR
jgi:acyl-coenzyme A thioesterase PaaI-like protein